MKSHCSHCEQPLEVPERTDDSRQMIDSLAYWLAAGKLDPAAVLPGMRTLTGDQPAALAVLLEMLADETDESLVALAGYLRRFLRDEMLRVHEARRLKRAIFEQPQLTGLALTAVDEWQAGLDATAAVMAAVNGLREPAGRAVTDAGRVLTALIERLPAAGFGQLADGWATDLPGREAALVWLEERRADFRQRWVAQLGQPAGDEDHGSLAEKFHAAESRAEQRRMVDLAGGWLTPAAVPALIAMAAEPWVRDRIGLNLTARFGQPDRHAWAEWQPWLEDQARRWQMAQEEFFRLIAAQGPALLAVVYSQLPDRDPALAEALVTRVIGVAPPPIVVARSAAQPPPLPQRVVVPVVPEEPPPPPKPSVWEVHIQPFFVENWYIVAGIAMVILGSSLLAYYTWDKHWLVRYTVMPLLLGGFTWSLAKVGDWIERKGREFIGTAAILRGAAIGLLPINFMAVALLSADEQVPQKGAALLAMALIYLVACGWGLRQWCGAVEHAVGKPLGGALLLLNALVVVGPLARTVGHLEGQALLRCVGGGFYLGFGVMAAVIVDFSRRILTREMAEEKRVPWFVAGALAVTFVQVFLWAHAFLRHLPQPATYAVLVILTGWLILHAERRALELKESPQLHGGESFLGFGAILLGLLMAFNDPWLRIAALLLAGGVWLYQGMARRHPLHHWIALTLLGLGGAAVGLLPHFPGSWLPLVGVGVALAFGLGAEVSRRLGAGSGLDKACDGMQLAALLLTALITPLVQWHYDSWPFASAIWLGLVAGLFAWRAFREEQVHLLHVTMAILALALPYAGFMDVAGRTVHHNTMVGGLAILSWLWLGVAWWLHKPLILQARSTVLWLYGLLAVAAMLLRVAMGDTGASADWLREVLDFGGPIAMTLALIPTTYHSRSLGPAGMAVIITVILFPELRSHLPESMGWVTSGSGLASAGCTLLLVGLCFALRPWGLLKDLPDGDRFMGKELFPLQRRDHTLFTWPILAAAVFLLVKVDSWNLLRNLANGPLSLNVALALAVSGVAWTAIGIYLRQHRAAVMGVHVGWICMAAGIGFGYWREASDPHWTTPVLAMGLLLQGLYSIYQFTARTRPWVTTLLSRPTRQVLVGGSVWVALACMAGLLDGEPLAGMGWLYGFLAAQLVWHGLRTRHWGFGLLVFLQCWVGLLALVTPGTGVLWLRLTVAHSLSPTLWLLAGVQLLMVALELAQTRRPVSQAIAALVSPGWLLATGLALVVGVAGVVDGVDGLRFSGGQQLLLLLALLLTARAHACSVMLWPAVLLGYLMLFRQSLAGLAGLDQRLEFLATPWRVAWFGLGIVGLSLVGRWVNERRERWLAGAFAVRVLAARSCAWLYWPALGLAAVAAVYHLADPALRESGVQLWTPYVGAITFALVARGWRQAGCWVGAGLLLVLGNVHLVRVSGGEWLRGHGLSELHLICLGLGLGLLQASALRRLPVAAGMAAINRACLGVAGLVLALLSANYFSASDLAAITPTRLLVSGVLAALAGWYFRRAARRPGPGEELHAEWCEALYHFGVVVALWCAALLVPAFRQPQFALIALGLPVAYFYGWAEFGKRHGRAEAPRYRNSAAVLGFVVLALYVFEGVFHLVLFPGAPVDTRQYHSNAALIVLLGVALLRLHGLGGTSWLAFYGGLALMAGSYFLLTALPGLSPFDHALPAAWCALVLGHFWILLSFERSPLRTFIQRLAGLDEAAWDSLRLVWGYCLLAATQSAVLWGLTDISETPKLVAPLLAGAASVIIHQGILRRSALYLTVAGAVLLVALHMDFLVPSYIPKAAIIWVGLGAWLGLLAAFQMLPGKLSPQLVGRIALGLGLLVLAHVLHHRPWSPVGLWGMGLGAAMLALTPADRAGPATGKLVGALQLGIPIWLVYFSQAPFKAHGLSAGLEPWPVLAATATLLLIALAGRFYRAGATQHRGFGLALGWLETDGLRVQWIAFGVVTALLCAVQTAHYQSALAPREFGLLVLLEAAVAVGWFLEGRDRQSMVANFLMQGCAAACFVSIRRHLMLTTGWWSPEYDVWASLAVSMGLAGVKQTLDVQPRALRVPLLTTLCVLPVLALGWVMGQGLGVDLALMVVGVHSVLFAYLGKDSRESPYNIVALAGFVGFILLTFYSKLQLRALHAYIIPVGMGVLVLQELFKKRIHPDARNGIRMVTLIAMLGSTGYYAMANPSHPISFNLTMIVLCLLAMGLGSVLRIRLYLALGFAGLMVDLISLLYKVLVQMERSARMTVVGSLVLVLGGGLIFAAIYYKTHKSEIERWLAGWRAKLARWQ